MQPAGRSVKGATLIIFLALSVSLSKIQKYFIIVETSKRLDF